MPSPSRLCLSRDGPRSAPAPQSVARLPPGRAGSPPGPGHLQRPLPLHLGARGSPELPPRTAAGLASPGPPVATVLQVPTTAPGAAWKLGAGDGGAPPSPALCVPNPAVPGPRTSLSRSRIPARRPPRRGAQRAPARTLWHSQWRRGWSCKFGPVAAAGAQAGPEPEALPSDRTTRR